MTDRESALAGGRAFQAVVASAEAAFGSLRLLMPTSIKGVEDVVESLIAHLERADAMLIPLFTGEARSLAPPRVAVCVGALAVAIGMKLRYSQTELAQVGLVALLLEVGGIGGARTSTDGRESAAFIRGFGSRYAQIATLVAQAHELEQDSGADTEKVQRAHAHAQIVALAATYESLSWRQPSGPRTWPPAAVKELVRRERARTPDAILKATIEILVTLPVGGIVRLNSGEVGCVVRKNAGLPLRPVISIPGRQDRQPAEPKLIDLQESPFLYVCEFLGDNGSGLEREDSA